jgi:hypothetical protein
VAFWAKALLSRRFESSAEMAAIIIPTVTRVGKTIFKLGPANLLTVLFIQKVSLAWLVKSPVKIWNIMLAGDIGMIEIKDHRMLRYYMEGQLGFGRVF